MVLTGRLSNQDLTTLFQRLRARDWKQAPRRYLPASGLAPDGRRKFGSVRDAILEVLAQAGCELPVREIHERVEKLLGEPVARSSVQMSLRRGCQRSPALFDYGRKMGYRLAVRLPARNQEKDD
jgi:hypothetical protein